MRIIDKQTDYYDYLQDNGDDLVFDRRGSRSLSKQEIKDDIIMMLESYAHIPHIFLVFQCGATYWLLSVEGRIGEPNWRKNYWDRVEDYDIELLSTWKDYNHPLELLTLKAIEFNESWKYDFYDKKWRRRKLERTLSKERLREISSTLRDAVINRDYKVYRNHSTKHFLLLKSSGIPNVIGPEEIYNAIDEYFSLKKTAAESTVAEGTTNNDKIKNHGFDVKTSFRGK
jgi:hypothetical protein